MPRDAKGIAAVLGKLSKEKPAEDEPREERGAGDGLEAVAGELIAAVEDKDAAAVASALRRAHQLCKYKEE